MFDWIFEWFQRRCPHSDDDVRADILEGSGGEHELKWCLRCGAYRHAWAGMDPKLTQWREPRATWSGSR